MSFCSKVNISFRFYTTYEIQVKGEEGGKRKRGENESFTGIHDRGMNCQLNLFCNIIKVQ